MLHITLFFVKKHKLKESFELCNYGCMGKKKMRKVMRTRTVLYLVSIFCNIVYTYLFNVLFKMLQNWSPPPLAFLSLQNPPKHDHMYLYGIVECMIKSNSESNLSLLCFECVFLRGTLLAVRNLNLWYKFGLIDDKL